MRFFWFLLTSVQATTITITGANENSDYVMSGTDANGAVSSSGDPELTFYVGTTVTFVKQISAHPFRIDDDSTGAQKLYVAGTGSADITFTETGRYQYYCTLHAQMRNYITVVAAPPPPPSTPIADVVCIEDTMNVELENGLWKPLRDVTVGTLLRTAAGGVTTVRDMVEQHSDDPPYVVPAGVCDAHAPTVLSPAHALRCEGKWTTAKEVGKRETRARSVRYVNLRTDNYCSDELRLDTGIVVETWDGRARDAWRPHTYVDGVRIGCHA